LKYIVIKMCIANILASRMSAEKILAEGRGWQQKNQDREITPKSLPPFYQC